MDAHNIRVVHGLSGCFGLAPVNAVTLSRILAAVGLRVVRQRFAEHLDDADAAFEHADFAFTCSPPKSPAVVDGAAWRVASALLEALPRADVQKVAPGWVKGQQHDAFPLRPLIPLGLTELETLLAQEAAPGEVFEALNRLRGRVQSAPSIDFISVAADALVDALVRARLLLRLYSMWCQPASPCTCGGGRGGPPSGIIPGAVAEVAA